jgi:hypothetical protein
LPEQITLTCFDATDSTAHTWWNPRTIKEAGPPQVSADGRTYSYAIPVDTWGVVAAVRGDDDASNFAVPAVRALVPDVWKKMDLEIEWGFDAMQIEPIAFAAVHRRAGNHLAAETWKNRRRARDQCRKRNGGDGPVKFFRHDMPPGE